MRNFHRQQDLYYYKFDFSIPIHIEHFTPRPSPCVHTVKLNHGD